MLNIPSGFIFHRGLACEREWLRADAGAVNRELVVAEPTHQLGLTLLGWKYGGADTLQPAAAITVPLLLSGGDGDEVNVVGMAPEEECEHEMFVRRPWEGRTLAVTLSQLKPVYAENETF